RCQSKCPANASGSELSPKFLITKMADLMRGEPILLRDGSTMRIGEAGNTQLPNPETLPLYDHGPSTENELWSCTTCRACMEECPAMIEHVDQIVDLRRNLTMIQSEVPPGVKRLLEGIERAGNPWRLPTRDRSAWAD